MEIRLAKQEHIDALKGRLRPADEAECLALGYPGDTAMQESFDGSAIAVVGISRGVPVFAAGVVPVGGLLSRDGLAWCLSTPEIPALARSFLRASRFIVHDLLVPARYKHLFNVVDARYTATLRWLRWLGFTLERAVPFGVNGELFHPFWLRS